MAYDKKYIENGDLVKEYLDDREDRIEGAFEGVDDEISQVNVKIDNKFADMIDYPIEQQLGDNQYTKWKSGRLTEVVRYKAELTSGANSIYVPLSNDTVGPGNAVAGIRSPSIAFQRVTLHRALARTSDVNVGISSETNATVEIIVFFEGRWK